MSKEVVCRLIYLACVVGSIVILAGCAAPINVIGGCEVPTHYDQAKTVGADLPAGTKSKAFAEAATAERGQHKADVDDYNGFLSYVKGECQGAKK